MRKLVVNNIVSLDGRFTGPDDNVMVLPMDRRFDKHNAERLRAADTLLLGRRTFDLFSGFWPGVADDPGQSEANRAFSRLINAVDKVVVSDTLTRDDFGPWPNTEVVRRADARRRIADLKAETGGDIMVAGSQTLWNDLLRADLVDEIYLMIGGVVVGDGRPAFDVGASATLRLLETRTWTDSDNILARYAVEVGRS